MILVAVTVMLWEPKYSVKRKNASIIHIGSKKVSM
jgi:hypothetical protein